MQQIIEAEDSDLYDVLAYVAFTSAPVAREERAFYARRKIHTSFGEKQEAFLEFVLTQYVSEGVWELDVSKLTPLLLLRYHALDDALVELGKPEQINAAFTGFQKYLYAERG
jgi:type I restriction enzyme R subunit